MQIHSPYATALAAVFLGLHARKVLARTLKNLPGVRSETPESCLRRQETPFNRLSNFKRLTDAPAG
jgi:hypothetical protein